MLYVSAIATIVTAFEHAPKITTQALAVIRIERPSIADPGQWESSAKESRRELIRRDEHGQPILLRVIDNQ